MIQNRIKLLQILTEFYLEVNDQDNAILIIVVTLSYKQVNYSNYLFFDNFFYTFSRGLLP